MLKLLGALLLSAIVMQPAYAQPASIEQQIEDALAALRPATQIEGREYPAQPLAALMKQRSVPGASIVVFHEGQIIYARGFGFAEAGGTQTITPETLFQAASISKPVAATAALALTEQGRLDLDAPVNEKLRSWRIPESDAAEGEAITLRQLLTHSAGLTVHGFPGYSAGSGLPTVVQILDGSPPANTAAVRIDQRPGATWRYSGGGFTVAQVLMSDVADEPFAELIKRLVLTPAGMTNSSFAQPLGDDTTASAALGHGGDGAPLAGGYNVYPELAAAGLWTTPTDLARWALALSAAYNGQDGGLLRPETARAMLTPGIGNWGIGVSVAGEGEWLSFGHGGANAGYRANLTAYPNRGDGIVILTNSDNGERLFRPIAMAVGRVLGWPESEPRTVVPVAVPTQALADVAGRYTGFGQSVEVAPMGDVLWATIANGPPPFELFPQGNDLFVSEEGMPVQFLRDAASGRVTGFSAAGGTLERVSDTLE
jgi:CubicO group peptidase (beta-lactamase class C family)